MKILALHCDYIKFKPLKKALKSAELEKDEDKERKIDECLVVFTAVESSDGIEIAKRLVENAKDIATQVKTKNIVLYPYAHLSSNLSSPDIAIEVLKEAEKTLKKDKEEYKVYRAPFGYYKEFELKCKGHPLSELSREINNEGKKPEINFPITKKEEKPLTAEDVKNLLRSISKSRLDTAKLKENDHRILGQKLDLFSFNEVAPGMVFWHNNGLIIYNELAEFWREMHRKNNYQEVKTPQIMDSKLWKISGHWDKYKENNFLTDYEKRIFLVKPMSCPGGILVFKNSPKSYKGLPLRVGELGVVHRCELSGVLAGLFRVIQFTQDDAHIYCTEKQMEDEVFNLLELVDLFYKKFNFDYAIELSTRPEKRIGDDKMWDLAEKTLKKVLEKRKVKFKINEGDGAFYGPKIDFHLRDSLGRTWQCGTIQLDFSMPERFEMTYTDRENEEKRPVMIHNAIYGSLERFIGILLEHTNGHLPVWLSPIQVRILSFTDRNIEFAQKIYEQLKEKGIRADFDFDSETINNKIRNAELQKIPYIIVIGDKEEQNNTLAVRIRGQSKPKFGVKIDEFIEQTLTEINNKMLGP
ncbi:threonine--tRNA ligase [Candidatus Pacearchaeota archaeon]|nr:threonine--tRNA ligase [Candidatus Pacearchaeota archaeon]